MSTLVDESALAEHHRAEYDVLHPEVLRYVGQLDVNAWELGRRFRRITDAALYKAGGYGSFEDYATRAARIPFSTAKLYKAVSVFPKDVVTEFGTTLCASILAYWSVNPGREDPAHVREFRFPIVVDGQLAEHVLGDDQVTAARLDDATARLKRRQLPLHSPLDALVVRFVDALERTLQSLPGFTVKTSGRGERTALTFFKVPVPDLVPFWRAVGAALLAAGSLDADEAPPPPALDVTLSSAPRLPVRTPALPDRAHLTPAPAHAQVRRPAARPTSAPRPGPRRGRR